MKLRKVLLPAVFVLCAFFTAAEGKRYAIVVGINEYLDSGFARLSTPRNDAKDLSSCLLAAGWDKTFVMTDDADARSQDFPTRANIGRRMSLLAELANPSDTVFLFFSGHGIRDSGGEYFLPVDADSLKIRDSSLSLAGEIKIFADRKIERTILAVDACRETVTTTKGIQVVGIGGGAQTPANIPGAGAILYATKEGWYSYEDAGGRNGVFTKYLINGLAGAASGAAANGASGGVTLADLSVWLPDAVSSYALEKGIRQKPVVSFNGSLLSSAVLSNAVKPEGSLPAAPAPAFVSSPVQEAPRGLGPVIIDEKQLLGAKISLAVYMRLHQPFFESEENGWKGIAGLNVPAGGFTALVRRNWVELKSSRVDPVKADLGLADGAFFGDSIIEWTVKNESQNTGWTLLARQDGTLGQELRFSFSANGLFQLESMVNGIVVAHTIHIGRSREFDTAGDNTFILAIKGNTYFLLVNDKPYCLIESRETSVQKGRFGMSFTATGPGSIFVKDVSIWDY